MIAASAPEAGLRDLHFLRAWAGSPSSIVPFSPELRTCHERDGLIESSWMGKNTAWLQRHREDQSGYIVLSLTAWNSGQLQC